MNDRERAIQAWIDEQERTFAAEFPDLVPRKRVPVAGSLEPVRYGYGDRQERIVVETRTRLEHAQIIGASGSGKSTFLEYVIKQDINNGHGVVVLDPHGGHEDSLFNKLLDFIREHRPSLIESGRVHILSPNTRDYVVGFNPLAPLPDTDLSVIADALSSAFERVWKADFHDNPNILTMLRATFIALCELGMTLPDAKLLYDPQDRHGVRARAIAELKNQYARDELTRIHELSLDPRKARDFDVNVIGPTNRLNDFVSSEAVATMLGMSRDHPTSPAKTIDLLDIMEKGHILLVDLQPGRAVSEQNTNLLGTILLRYLFLNAKLRSNFNPFFVYVDECHHYMTEDVPRMLAEMRKYGVSVNLAHQWLSQLGKPGEPTYDALIKGTLTKVIFRVADQKEAEDLAQTAVPLDLEMGVEASKRPVQIGHEISLLRGRSIGEGSADARGTTIVESVTHSRAETLMHSVSSAHIDSRAVGTSAADAIASSFGHGDGIAIQVDPNNPGLLLPQMPLGQTLSSSDQFSRSQSEIKGASEMTGSADVSGENFGEAVTRGDARGVAQGQSESRAEQRSKTNSETEAIVPIYDERHTTWHSKDNVLYMAARTILTLPTGRAILYVRGTTSYLNVPALDKPKRVT